MTFSRTLLALLLPLLLTAADGPVLRLNSAGIKAVLRDGKTAIVLPIENQGGAPVRVHATLEWLNPANKVRSTLEFAGDAAPGAGEVVVPFPLSPKAGVWDRLRYAVHADGLDASGMLALSQIAEHVFDLHVVYGYPPSAGAEYRLLAAAVHPVTGLPLRDVMVEASSGTKTVRGVTDVQGLVTLKVPVPAVGRHEDEVSFAIKAARGDFARDTELQVPLLRFLQVSIAPDKPIYQPGQILHARIVCFTPAGRAAGSVPLKVSIEDPDDTDVFTTRLVTNGFGVAASDWHIPDNVRLGDYRISVTAGSDDESQVFDVRSSLAVKISRYDLPEFAVTVKPDRKYYLPGQDAVVEVQADYIFGKPVPRGHVRVVQETSREWNYKLQKWDIEEGQVQEGNADALGNFRTTLSLAEDHEDLADDDYKRYRDLSFAAYVRDPSTGRTEQRRFDVRVTRDPIHIYPIDFYRQGPYYVSTSYADGTPAVCRVRIEGGVEITTNRYGVARIQRLPDTDPVVLRADDGHGGIGRWEERLYGSADIWISLHTDRTLYHPGEPIRVEVETREPVPAVALGAFRQDRLLSLEWLKLEGGRASIEIPWRPEFLREIARSVATPEDMSPAASKTVLFPYNTDLLVGVRLAQAVHRPGDQVAAVLEVASPGGKPIESALGVAVVDAAVGERARANGESAEASSEARWMWQGWGSRAGDWDGPVLGGVSLADLYRLDPEKPFPQDLDLTAEALLAGSVPPVMVGGTVDYARGLETEFRQVFDAQLAKIRDALDTRYKQDYTWPRDLVALKRVLVSAGIDFDSLRDPWDSPYRAEFDAQGAHDRIFITAAGPDRISGTDDDCVAFIIPREHIQPLHDAIERAFKALPAFPSTEREARAALAAAYIDIDRARDSWGTVYRLKFRIDKANAAVSFGSAGPDREFGTKDDFETGRIEGPYFTATERKLSEIVATAKQFPRGDLEWQRLLGIAGLFPVKDLWGRPLYAVFGTRSDRSNVIQFYVAAQYGARPEMRKTLVPTTQQSMTITLRSAGQDGVQGNGDDFTLAVFSRTESYRTDNQEVNRLLSSGQEHGGSIRGLVADQSGAVIPNARVIVALNSSGKRIALQFEARTDNRGSYLISGLPAGRYDVHIGALGFISYVTTGVPVAAGRTVAVNAVLPVSGGATQVVTVSSSAELLQTASASVSAVVGKSNPTTTPRLREYFPETLLWEPLLETGPDGRAQVRFKLADNITTWKLSVMASTVEGETGTATADIRAFQPFFVDHNPPRILTQGDEIQLPVTIRNYLDREQAVSATVKPETWFDLEGPHERQLRIAAGESANAIFPMRATSAVADGKQRITATSAEAGDAIEKPVTVHPDGNQLSETVNDVFGDTSSLKLTIPAGAILDSTRAELRIYPNLISHLVESIEAILERPYGCGEQTISSTYPSLLLLKYLKRAGRDDHPLAATARRYLQQGFDRLRGYEAPDGGFTYWGRGEADLSLTAYALTFLSDAGEFVSVPDELIDRTERFLKKNQRPDGSWKTPEDTALIALALSGLDDAPALEPALGYLSKRASQMDEPYLLAAFAILRRLTRSERGLTYWNLEANTPFYGWGTAGRLETTALALRAFQIANQPQDRDLTSHSLLFLLRNKDRYGVWYSTQATIRVLDAILEAATTDRGTGEPGSAEIRVNDRLVQTVPLPGPMEIAPPIRVDLSRELGGGENMVSLHRAQAGTPAQVQLAATWYVPWPSKAETQEGPLRLKVAFDKTALSQNDVVICHVDAERVGFRGHGMLLGEIGLPPGADVDRQSLERAMSESGYALSRYDILPDRVIVYLWPRAGGTKFSFNFRPRFAMRARTAPSSLYDYYNPDARAAVPPVSFSVR